jgi:acyl transferase domain-containing protein
MTAVNDAVERLWKLSPKRLALLALELQEKLETAQRSFSEGIAIVGMSCRFPGGIDDPASFWRLLEDGGDAITEVPQQRWDIEAYYDPELSSPLTMNTRWGGFIEGADRFDPEFFGISRREACAMDPQQRIILELAWEAIERAGMAPEQLASSDTGVFVGANSIDYYGLMDGPPSRGGSGVALSIISNRLSHFFDLRGPSMTIDTACSSSLVAIDLACQSLRSGAIDTALAGGVNLILSPVTTIAASQAGMMSPDGRCKSFDARANGYVRSEGAGLVVLKRISDAIADHDHIHAVIRGSAINQDGRTGVLTAPSGPAQQAVIRRALANAGIDASAISYLETHGTGTPLGDSIEVEALGRVFGVRDDGSRCALGAVKTNLGHTEAAAGVAGLIKLALALENRTIPPVIHFERLNPHVSLSGTPFVIPTAAIPWPSGAGPRTAGLSSFGFGGTNVHVVIEEAPVHSADAEEATRDWHVLPLSARSETALRALAARWASYFDEHPEVSFHSACFVAGTGRKHFQHRLAVAASSASEARDCLRNFSGERGTPSNGRAVAFLFSGLSTLPGGMARELYTAELAFRSALDRCAEAANAQLSHPLLDVLLAETRSPLLEDVASAEPALLALEWALSELWRTRGVTPSAVIGHGVGEYAAACVAGVLSIEDALALAVERSRAMAEIPPATLSDRAENMRVESYMPPLASKPFSTRTAGIRFEPARIPLLSSIGGRRCGVGEIPDASHWAGRLTGAAWFENQIQALVNEFGCRLLLEIGPGDALARAAGNWLLRNPAPQVRSFASEAHAEAISAFYVHGVALNWPAITPETARTRIPLPSYPFERKRCWLDPEEVRPFPGERAAR